MDDQNLILIEMKALRGQNQIFKPNRLNSLLSDEEELYLPPRKGQSFYVRLDAYQTSLMQTKENQVDDETTHIREIMLLVLQVALSALKAPLYLLIDYNGILRVAWCQIVIGLIYMGIGLHSSSQSNFSLGDLFMGRNLIIFLIVCSTQTIYVSSLSLSIEYTDISITLMLYNSSVLIFFIYKYVRGVSYTHLESLGGSLGILSLFFILLEEYSHQHIFGYVLSLTGATSSLIYAYYIYYLETRIPHYILLSMTRLVPGIVLLIISLLTQKVSGLIDHDFFTPRIMLILFIHVILTEIVVNYLQRWIMKALDPFSQKIGSLFEPIPGSVYAYLLHEQDLPSSWVWICMISFIVSSILMQRGRLQREAKDINFKRMTMLETI